MEIMRFCGSGSGWPGGELKEQMKYWKEQLAGLQDAGVAG